MVCYNCVDFSQIQVALMALNQYIYDANMLIIANYVVIINTISGECEKVDKFSVIKWKQIAQNFLIL